MINDFPAGESINFSVKHGTEERVNVLYTVKSTEIYVLEATEGGVKG